MTDTTRAMLEQALNALTSFEQNYGSLWYSSYEPDQIDSVCSALRAELAKPVELSYTATQLAAMVLSDCGISTNHTALHERVAERITRHEEQLIDGLKKGGSA